MAISTRVKPANELKPMKFDVILKRLFVYGNLMRGFPMHHWLDGQIFIGEAKTGNFYKLYDLGGCPAMVRCTVNGVRIKGELYYVNEELLKKIDIAEGKGVLYNRETISIDEPDQTYGVYAYIFQRPVTGYKECGDSWPPKERAY